MTNERQLKDILKNLAEKSSVPGINQIFSSKQFAIKLLWSIMLLATTGVASFQLYQLLKDYYSYPIKTRVSLEFNALPYPALSFCNMNPIKKSMVVNASDAVRNIIYPRQNGQIKKNTSLKSRKKREVDPSVLLNSEFTSLKTDVLSPVESTHYISPTTVKNMETSHMTKGYESKYDSDYESRTSDYSEYDGGSGNTYYYWDWPTFDPYTWSDSSLWAEWSWSQSTNYEEESFNNPHVSWEEYYYDQVLAPKDRWIQRIEHFKTAFKNESL
ncbi:hypothetical protein ACJMK2_035348 [Sinanodonta woodiana]|uniref:Uncharacterized protein n=1 Tax=Sinanodonta woodiana TaxID=1069815 RepID=A0ABD3WUN9_SINWO